MFTEQQLIRIGKYAILHGYEKTKQVFFVSHSTVAKAVKLMDEIEPNFKIEHITDILTTKEEMKQ